MIFTLPSGMIRALGGWLSDKYGARSVNWAVFWVSLVCLFFLSYPQTTLTVHGINGDIKFNIGLGVWVFTVLVFIVGIAQGIGKASVYRIIHDYYPNHMGAVGGIVGVIGGLGGFTLPIVFGAVSDLFGVRSSCFMVLYGVLVICMFWMNHSIKKLRREQGLELAASEV
jgi:NNP family nitrate/nitrite transporter-like MFS transporter